MYASQQGKRLIDEHTVAFVMEHEMLDVSIIPIPCRSFLAGATLILPLIPWNALHEEKSITFLLIFRARCGKLKKTSGGIIS